jgi:excisionase family DNA binding protein
LFDPITEATELPDHSRGTVLLRLLGDGWAPFFVTNSLVQDQPDQSTLSMGNRPDGLVMSQEAWDRAAIHNFEDASFGPGCGVGALIENTPHVAVALRRPVVVVHASAFVVAGACTNPRGETFLRGKGRCGGTNFGNDLLRRVHSQTGHFRQPLDRVLVRTEQTRMRSKTHAAPAIGDRLLTLREAAEVPGLSTRKVREYVKRGDIRGKIIGKRWRFRRADLDAFFENAPRSWDFAGKNSHGD